MHHDHRLAPLRAHQPHLHVTRPGAALAEARRQLLGGGEDARPRGADPLDRRSRIRHVDELDLADHRARVGLGGKSASRPRDERGARGGGDHRRLLDHHRDHVVASVHLEVERHTEGQREGADGVLDHHVGHLERQRVGRRERLHGGRSEAGGFGQLLPPFRYRQPVERRDP